MKFTCTTLRKTSDIEKKEEYVFNGHTLKCEKIFYKGCTLTSEFAELFMVLKEPVRNKKYLHFKSVSWLTSADDSTDDSDAVNDLNKRVCDLFPDVHTCSDMLTVSARIHKTMKMSDLCFSDVVFNGVTSYYRKIDEIDVIFCERVTSYTKTFDLSFVLRNGKVETHSCLNRKMLGDISNWASNKQLEFYET